jgi:hypothetical protein
VFRDMAQTSFGRRHASSQQPAPSASAPAEGSSRVVVLSSAAASFVAFAALGYFLAPSDTSRFDGAASAPSITDARPAPPECRGKPDCKNEYSVELRCGETGEAKTTSVVAPSAEAAGVTAERYNRGCRTRRTAFLAVIVKGPSHIANVESRPTAEKAPARARSFRGGRRGRLRLR